MKLNKSVVLLMILALSGCQSSAIDIAENPSSSSSNNTNSSANPLTVKSPIATPNSILTSSSSKPVVDQSPNPNDANLPSSMPGEPSDKDTVTTDTEVAKSNIDWKLYNPVIKGKKYIYNYSIKEGDTNISTETTWEITAVQDKNYTLRQSFTGSGDNKLRATDVPVTLNNDFSPPIIPPISVSGEKLTDVKQVQINETPEKIKVPYKELDAIKVVSDSGNINNWYAKDIGLAKSVVITASGTYTLELKDYK